VHRRVVACLHRRIVIEDCELERRLANGAPGRPLDAIGQGLRWLARQRADAHLDAARGRDHVQRLSAPHAGDGQRGEGHRLEVLAGRNALPSEVLAKGRQRHDRAGGRLDRVPPEVRRSRVGRHAVDVQPHRQVPLVHAHGLEARRLPHDHRGRRDGLVGRPVVDQVPRAERAQFLVAGQHQRERRLQIGGSRPAHRIQRDGQRPLHVAGPTTHELPIAFGEDERIPGPVRLERGNAVEVTAPGEPGTVLGRRAGRDDHVAPRGAFIALGGAGQDSHANPRHVEVGTDQVDDALVAEPARRVDGDEPREHRAVGECFGGHTRRW
jgi:hypothetical protein